MKYEELTDEQKGSLYDTVVEVFGMEQGIPEEELPDYAETFDTLYVKAVELFNQKGYDFIPDNIKTYSEEIKSFTLGSNEPESDNEKVDRLGKELGMIRKYGLAGIAIFFIALLFNKFAKVVAVIGLACIGVVWYNAWENKKKLKPKK